MEDLFSQKRDFRVVRLSEADARGTSLISTRDLKARFMPLC